MFGHKRKRHDLVEKMKLEIILLKSTKKCDDLRIAELEAIQNDYESEPYSLSIEMKFLKTLCLEKISNLESNNRSSTEIEEIKKMVIVTCLKNNSIG